MASREIEQRDREGESGCGGGLRACVFLSEEGGSGEEREGKRAAL
jgi:hypothetical protein